MNDIGIIIAFLEFAAQEIQANVSSTTLQNFAAMAEAFLPRIEAAAPALLSQVQAMVDVWKAGGTVSAAEIVSLQGQLTALAQQSAAVDQQIASGD